MVEDDRTVLDDETEEAGTVVVTDILERGTQLCRIDRSGRHHRPSVGPSTPGRAYAG